jgi:hypothetical protein
MIPIAKLVQIPIQLPLGFGVVDNAPLELVALAMIPPTCDVALAKTTIRFDIIVWGLLLVASLIALAAFDVASVYKLAASLVAVSKPLTAFMRIKDEGVTMEVTTLKTLATSPVAVSRRDNASARFSSFATSVATTTMERIDTIRIENFMVRIY